MIAFVACAPARKQCAPRSFSRGAARRPRICAASRVACGLALPRWTAICTLRRRRPPEHHLDQAISIVTVCWRGRRGRWWPGRAGARGSPIGRWPGTNTTMPTCPRRRRPTICRCWRPRSPSAIRWPTRPTASWRLEGRLPAQDVNAADEVPCSTWFCARNHLRPMSAGEIAAGPAVVPPRHAAHDHQGQGSRRRLRLPGQGRGGTKVHAEVRRRRPPRHGERRRDDRQPHLPRRRLQRPRRALDRSRPRRSEGRARRRPSSSTSVQKRPLTAAHVGATLSKVRAAARRPPAGGGRPLDPGKHPGWVRHAGRARRRSQRPHSPPAPPVGARELDAVRLAVRPRSELDQHDRQLRRGRGAVTSSATTSSTSAARSARRRTTRRACSRTANIWSRSAGRWPRCSRWASTGGRFRTSGTSGSG